MTTAIAVMVSGRGSNLHSILEYTAQGVRSQGESALRVELVISDRADAQALDVARAAGVPQVRFVDPREYADREEFDGVCADMIERAGCRWIVLAGYMRILSSQFVKRFVDAIVNIHPSLLPAFPGVHGVEDALRYGAKVSGCTVHLVDEQIDHGAILAQSAVAVCDDDDVDSLRARIQQVEHTLYPHLLHRLVTEGFDVDGRRVIWRGGGI
ncbi:MAG: phosphoribosylglycinamide formyltransferase [Mariprofundales bacterium]|nr:phosphoribosylglycinamide formyltransferase [Mariprofundales bacterium]